ncbi:DNA polymerase IV [uncultured Psychrosphaera sp.]|uniref:DNA polymerase IV n=1 Tax=uncultured Psychrosphaera sp. TaxID=1403522 RepID=UPI0030F50362
MRKIIHIDMDCYYAAVEMRENPALKDVPIAVGGDTERGVLCTSNYIARQYGVRAAMSSRKAKLLCPELQIIPMQMALYKSISNQIRDIFRQYTDLIEPLSLDEAYLDVTNCTLFGGSATLIAQDILNKIYLETGLTASAGVSVNKFIAKVASDFNKPNGMCVVPPNKIIEFVQQLPVKAIPGVGKVMQKKLNQYGIQFCADLERFSIKELEQKFGKMGISLFNRIRGVDDRPVCNHRESKTTSVETTFDQDIKVEQINTELLNKLTQRLYQRLEKENKPIAKLQVKLKFDDFISKTKETQHTCVNIDLCHEMLIEIAKQRPVNKIRLIGIGVGYGKEPIQQLQLFAQPNGL